MSIERSDPEAPVGAGRGDVVVCIPVRDAYEHYIACLRSVLAHTPHDVPIMICDDASSDPRIGSVLDEIARAQEIPHRISYRRHDANVGFPANVNAALRAAAPADLIVLNSDCVVAAGWVEGLRDAAAGDSRIATVTALTNHGSIVSVPERRPMPGLPKDWTFDDAAAAIQRRSLRIRPRLPTAIGHCVLITRAAVELVGEFDLAFTPGYGEEVDFSQRCLQNGLCHVLADDVLVQHDGGGSFGRDVARSRLQDDHERLIRARYPYYHASVRAIERDDAGPLARALGVARRALKGLSVVVDGQILSGPMTGTQLQVLEVIAALARTGRVELSVVVPNRPGDYALHTLRGLPHVGVTTQAEAASSTAKADLVHRPYQVNNHAELAFLASLGERLVITNQDLIAYHNPAYFAAAEDWQAYRRLTRTSLGLADHVVFISEHARADARAEDLVELERTSIVHNGVDHSLSLEVGAPVAPRGAERVPADAQTILCLGTDFRHKNRPFALRMLDCLRTRHGWRGWLLLAGPRVDRGSSSSQEAELLALRPSLAEAVVDFAAVSEAEKAWLFRRADLVLYPTVHEGFGLVPFEAAAQGRACLWAPTTSLAEVLPPEAAGIEPWDVEASASAALALLRDEAARQESVERVRAAAAGLTWDAAAQALLGVFEQTCDAPAVPRAGIQRRDGIIEARISDDAMRLVGPGGALPSDVERPLLALATHRAVGAPVFGMIRAGYRMSFGLRRRSRPPTRTTDSAASDLEAVR